MSKPFFIFNGIDSTNYIIVNKLPPIYKAEKNILKIEIEGRDGFLTQDLGTYKSIVKPVECTIANLNNIDYICNWLTGSGNIIFSNESDKFYKGTIINEVEFKRNFAMFHTGIIEFDCQPHKYNIDNNVMTFTTSPVSLYNWGALSKPILKIYGTGDIDLTINNNVINLTGITSDITIDSDLMDAYSGTTLMNNQMIGNFPEFISGNNIISWTGSISKIEVTPNWRWI